MFVLGVTEGMAFWLPLFISACAIVVTIWVAQSQRSLVKDMAVIAESVRKYERLEDKGEAQLTLLKKDLHDANVKLIDTRFREMTHEMLNHVNGFAATLHTLTKTVASVETSLRDAGQRIDKLGDSDHAIQKETLQLVHEVKDQCPSKEDLKDHQTSVDGKFDKLHERIDDMAQGMATKQDLEYLRGELRRG